MSWKVRAQGSTLGMVADEAEVRRALTLFADPENACEVRALTSGAHETLDGSDIDGLCRAVSTLPSGIGIYFILNPLPIGLSDPGKNSDIVCRRWIYIDVDPVKAIENKGKSASDAEKEGARETGQKVHDYLAECGWPSPVIVDSGNGIALYYRADLPNDDIVKASYSRLLNVLAKKFSGDRGSIDKSVHSAAQLVKVPGTWARKGPSTDDRPHRPCRIVFVPRDLEKVTFEELRAAGQDKGEPSANGTAPKPKGTANDAKRDLDLGCARIIMATKTNEGRNNALNSVAFEIGKKYVGPGLIDRQDVFDRLYDAACESGLDTDDNCGLEGIRKTINSGLGSGEKAPPDPTATFPESKVERPADGPVIYWASSVEPRAVEWLWPGRIPLGKLTTFAGNGGLGKTFVLCDMMARITRGADWPDAVGTSQAPGKCLFISGEDDDDDTLVPRLIELGADLDKVAFLKTGVMDRFTLSDLPVLEAALDQMEKGTRFVGIDPPTAFLGGVNDHKNAELRGLLTPLKNWAKKHMVSIVFNTHVTKPQGAKVEAMMRVMGSVAWVNAVRAAHMFAKDPEDQEKRIFVGMKNNLGRERKGLAYRIQPLESGQARIEWLGEVDTTADDAANNQSTKRKRSVVAADWIAEFFESADKVPSSAIWKARKETTLSENAVKEAKEEMGIRAKQEYDTDGHQQWVWYWPSEARNTWLGAKPGDHPEG